MSNIEIKTISGIVIDTFEDQVLGLCYAKILTNENLESVKLPTTLSNYKFAHLLQPHFLLELELVKTRKNWILRTIVSHKQIFHPQTFQDFVNLSSISKLLRDNLRDQEQTHILSFVVDYLGNHELSFNLQEFENHLQRALGYL